MLTLYPDEAGMNSGFARRPAGARSLSHWGCGRMRTFMRAVCGVIAIGGLVVVGGCAARPAAWRGAGPASPSASASSTPAPAVLVTAPADGATGVPTAAEVELSGASAPTSVTLTDATGAPGAGT